MIQVFLKWFESYTSTLILTFLGMALTIVALLMAFRHSNKLGRIANSLSTRYVGSFPEHVHKIYRAVQDAQESIVVFSDCVDYGSFSQPREHAKLLRALQCALDPSRFTFPVRLWRKLLGRRRAVSVNFLIWGKPQLISTANRLNSSTSFAQAAPHAVKAFVKGLSLYQKEFVKEYQSQFDVLKHLAENDHTDWTSPAAKQACEDVQQALHMWEVRLLTSKGAIVDGQFFESTLAGDKSDLSTRLANVPKAEYFFWIIDDEKAVVLFTDPGEDALAFFTQDFYLLKLLRHTFKQKYADATGREWSPP